MHQLLAQQPTPIRQLAEKIEDGIKRSILVRQQLAPNASGHADDFNGGVPAQYASLQFGQAAIGAPIKVEFVYYGQTAKPEDVAHELCHAERYFLEKIPMLHYPDPYVTSPTGVPIPPGRMKWGSAQWIDNYLEHFHVFRKTAALGYGDEQRMDRNWGVMWSELAPIARKYRNSIPERWHMLLEHSLTKSFCTDDEVKARADEILNDARLLERAQMLRSALILNLPDKLSMLRVAVNEFDAIPKETTGFDRWDFAREEVRRGRLFEAGTVCH